MKRVLSLTELKNAHLHCRLKGHSWKHITDRIEAQYRGSPTLIERVYQCGSCTTEAVELITIPRFELLKRTYLYPDNYLMIKAEDQVGRIPQSDIRAESFYRTGLINPKQVQRMQDREEADEAAAG